MDSRIEISKLVVESKAINLYIYFTLFFSALMGASFLYVYFTEEMSQQVFQVIALCTFVIYLSYIIRFALVRNVESIKLKVISSENEDEALNHVFGGVIWGVSTAFIIGGILYFSLVYV